VARGGATQRKRLPFRVDAVFKKIWQSMKVSRPTTTGPSSEQRNVRDVPRAEIQII
jgi:hypothetical protein